ncbi:hypothetical protein SAMN05216390_11055 [Lachnospiraceae bacterium KH1T2]|nr:hypothetical protein SAMN05216390_11055 [Lachnospiraceae bacterium KH1T2]
MKKLSQIDNAEEKIYIENYVTALYTKGVFSVMAAVVISLVGLLLIFLDVKIAAAIIENNDNGILFAFVFLLFLFGLFMLMALPILGADRKKYREFCKDIRNGNLIISKVNVGEVLRTTHKGIDSYYAESFIDEDGVAYDKDFSSRLYGYTGHINGYKQGIYFESVKNYSSRPYRGIIPCR